MKPLLKVKSTIFIRFSIIDCELPVPFNPLTPTVAIMCKAIKHPVPNRVKPSFVSFDIRAL